MGEGGGRVASVQGGGGGSGWALLVSGRGGGAICQEVWRVGGKPAPRGNPHAKARRKTMRPSRGGQRRLGVGLEGLGLFGGVRVVRCGEGGGLVRATGNGRGQCVVCAVWGVFFLVGGGVGVRVERKPRGREMGKGGSVTRKNVAGRVWRGRWGPVSGSVGWSECVRGMGEVKSKQTTRGGRG